MFALAMGRLSNRKGPVGRSSLLAVELAPRHSFYDRCILRPVQRDPGRGGVRRDGRDALPAVLRGRGPPVGSARTVLPDAVRRPVRGAGFGARDRMALRRLAVAASLPGAGRGRARARPLHAQRDPLAAAAGSSPRRVRFHPGDRGPARSGAGPADRCRCLDPAGQCGAAPPGAPGHRRGLPGEAAPPGPGERPRDPDHGRP
jgi:hypothetical protein